MGLTDELEQRYDRHGNQTSNTPLSTLDIHKEKLASRLEKSSMEMTRYQEEAWAKLNTCAAPLPQTSGRKILRTLHAKLLCVLFVHVAVFPMNQTARLTSSKAARIVSMKTVKLRFPWKKFHSSQGVNSTSPDVEKGNWIPGSSHTRIATQLVGQPCPKVGYKKTIYNKAASTKKRTFSPVWLNARRSLW